MYAIPFYNDLTLENLSDIVTAIQTFEIKQ
jgi:hypothetical protein